VSDSVGFGFGICHIPKKEIQQRKYKNTTAGIPLGILK